MGLPVVAADLKKGAMRLLPVFIVLLLSIALTGCGPLTFVVGRSAGDQRLVATVVEPDGRLGSDRIAVIDVSGVLVNAEKPSLLQEGENPVSLLHEQLAAAAGDSRVRAVILRINSPGGAVTASDIMYRDVRRFREETGKPVVALLMDVAASGGYYLACAADEIIAYPTTVTGSIGVIVQTVSLKPALERWGVQTEAITSGPNKDAGSPLSVLTPGHREVLEELVDDFYARFLDVVRERRPAIPTDHFAEVTDGRVLSGQEAASLGVVDRTGDLTLAAGAARRLAAVSHADLVRYHRPLDYVGSPYASAPAAPVGTQSNLIGINVNDLPSLLQTPVGIYYLWRPDLP